MMGYAFEKEIWSRIFAVPCEVVDKHLKLCSDLALRVLLILLRHSGDCERCEIAQLTGKSEADVQDALDYWAQAGILSADSTSAPTPAQAPTVPFQQVSESAHRAPDADTRPRGTGRELLVYELIAQADPEPETQGSPQKVQVLGGGRLRLSTQQINEMADKDENIAYLLQEAQSVLGKVLTPVATDVIVSLYTYYGMQPDLVLMLLLYCVTMGKDNMRYIEKVAATWIEKGIDSHEKAEQEIRRATEMSKVENKIKAAFGIWDRKLIASEQKLIDTWVNEYHFTVEMISLAFERCVEQKGKMSFAYIGGILTNWHAKGIDTPLGALKDMQQGKPRMEAVAAAVASKGSGASSSYDIRELEDMITYRNVLD